MTMFDYMLNTVLNIKKIEISSFPNEVMVILRNLYVNFTYMKLENGIKEYVI